MKKINLLLLLFFLFSCEENTEDNNVNDNFNSLIKRIEITWNYTTGENDKENINFEYDNQNRVKKINFEYDNQNNTGYITFTYLGSSLEIYYYKGDIKLNCELDENNNIIFIEEYGEITYNTEGYMTKCKSYCNGGRIDNIENFLIENENIVTYSYFKCEEDTSVYTLDYYEYNNTSNWDFTNIKPFVINLLSGKNSCNLVKTKTELFNDYTTVSKFTYDFDNKERVIKVFEEHRDGSGEINHTMIQNFTYY